MPRDHRYAAHLVWTGASAGAVTDYHSYSRAFRAEIAGKPPLVGSADAAFLGDPAQHNPEDLLLTALSACHMLSFLAEAAMAKVLVLAYEDRATALMQYGGGVGQFAEVELHPLVTAPAADDATLARLHERAHRGCIIARSVNFPVRWNARAVRS